MHNLKCAHTSDLQLPSMAWLDEFVAPHASFKRRTIRHHAQRMQHLGNAVVCTVSRCLLLCESRTGKHGDLVNVTKLSIAFAFKGGPKIGDKYLCSLEEPNLLSLKGPLVFEARKLLR